MNRVELEGVVAHELSHIRNYDILVSTLAVMMVGAVALMADLAIRMMWWNGGRVARRGDQPDGNNPLAYVGIALLVVAPIIAKVMQATISRRRETLADVSACELHAVSAWADLGAREVEGRHDGDAFRVHRYGTLVDRAADERRRRRRQAGRHPPTFRHPPPARRANRTPERTLMKHLRPIAALVALSLVAVACGGGGDESADSDRAVDHDGAHDHHRAGHDHQQFVDDLDDGGAETIRQPLTGQPPASEDEIIQRPALVAKIDNDPAAVPNHSGLAVADIVFEEVVEGRTTRFAAVFHSQSSDPIGPIRSGRSQDIDLFTSFFFPLFVWSGGNPGVTRAINESTLVNMGPNNARGYYRGPGYAPHNLYTSTDVIWEQATGRPARCRRVEQYVYLDADEAFRGRRHGGREGPYRQREHRVDLERRVLEVRSLAASWPGPRRQAVRPDPGLQRRGDGSAVHPESSRPKQPRGPDRGNWPGLGVQRRPGHHGYVSSAT